MLIVICKSNGAEYIPERNLADCDLDNTVRDIAAGQWTNVEQVIQTSTGFDVTETVARQVARIWAERNEPYSEWEKSFLSTHIRRLPPSNVREAGFRVVGKRIHEAAE